MPEVAAVPPRVDFRDMEFDARKRSRLNGSVLLVALLAVVGFGSVLLFWTVSARADELSDI
jgi:hypothetical protein